MRSRGRAWREGAEWGLGTSKVPFLSFSFLFHVHSSQVLGKLQILSSARSNEEEGVYFVLCYCTISSFRTGTTSVP